MKIAVPREIKPLEGRVALVPQACGELLRHGHQVFVQEGAGENSGFGDEQYRAAGARMLPDAAAVYDTGELVVKVKEPYGREPDMLRKGQTLFCFLHLAAEPDLLGRMLGSGVTGVAFETVQEADGSLPILTPMSDIAGRIAVQVGATLLHRPKGGKGLLLGGIPAAERGRVVVIGAGNAGGSAVRMAADMGAEVTVFDRNPQKLGLMRQIGSNVTALYPYADSVSEAVASADLLVGAVLIPGARAPRVVSRAQVAAMSPGSVVVDISVDQGGCIETTRATTYADPTYSVEGVIHFCVTNMPGAVPRTASKALCAALMPYLLRLAGPDWRDDEVLARGVNVDAGNIILPILQAL
jgi:alanine dehydrogenase